MATKKRGRPKFDGDIMDAIDAYADEGWSPAQIHRELGKRAEFASRLPTLRTVQRYVSDRPYDPSGTWSLEQAQPDELETLLPILAAVIERTEGRLTYLTNTEAQWLTRLGRVAADLGEWMLYRLARMYIRRKDAGEATDDLDAYLAFAPWRGPESERRYSEIWGAGKIPPAPFSIKGMSLLRVERSRTG